MRRLNKSLMVVSSVAWIAASFPVQAQSPAQPFSPADANKFMRTYCQGCHQGKNPAGDLDTTKYNTKESFLERPDQWTSIINRVKNHEMPPKGVKPPPDELREQFSDWAHGSLRVAACAEGIRPGPAPIRRLNKNEYRLTVRDLLGIYIDVSADLPADGAGGEGFDNAAETLFLSPIHAEKYLEAARIASAVILGDARNRKQVFFAQPGPDLKPEAAARKILDSMLPRAFRRPVTEQDKKPFVDIFLASQKQKQSFDDSMGLVVRAILISPDFLFRSENRNTSADPRIIDDYAFATRLSYFLWGTMPDNILFDTAAEGRLQEPKVLEWQIARMLRHPKAIDFVESFTEQWLGTRDLGKSFKPDAKLFPTYAADDEIRSDIRYQPIMFFRELLVKDLSLLNLIDSDFTFTTRKLQKHYGVNLPMDRQGNAGMPQLTKLPEGNDRGGILGMAAVLAISSHPHRTSPVLRGKWVLDALLGTPPPPAPPNVPELKEHDAAAPKTLRETLSQHRADPVCASCHNRIDPIGFALENYDVLGRWRNEDAGQPLDTSAELPDGTKFNGPKELKKILMDRKDLLIHRVTSKMLGYALGRGLTLNDSCTVDEIVAELKKNDYKAQTLIRQIVLSMPFRYQSGVVSKSAAPGEKRLTANAGER